MRIIIYLKKIRYQACMQVTNVLYNQYILQFAKIHNFQHVVCKTLIMFKIWNEKMIFIDNDLPNNRFCNILLTKYMSLRFLLK